MALETGDGFISGLVPTNPVNATDQVAQGDDHIRLIKTALKGTFPNLNAAVTSSPTELNILDGATLSTAELNILDGVTLSAVQINDAARKTAANLFTARNLFAPAESTSITVSSDQPNLQIFGTGGDGSSALALRANASNAGGAFRVARLKTSSFSDFTAVASGDFLGSFYAHGPDGDSLELGAELRFSAIETWSGSQRGARLEIRTIGAGGTTAGTRASFDSVEIDLTATTLDFNGNVDISGALTAATIANSTSTTLVAGQLHFIDSNATLPNLTAGQWVQVVNDSGSSITISKNGSDTTYWATTGAAVSTSFTLAARGVLTARSNPAGTAVYVTGSGITGAT